jgi:hypothetical protein
MRAPYLMAYGYHQINLKVAKEGREGEEEV